MNEPNRAGPIDDGSGGVRARTLVMIRWMAILGQLTAVLAVWLGLRLDLPAFECLTVIALSAGLNFVAALRMDKPLGAWSATAWLAFDTAQVAALLSLTGGLTNPFSILLLAPVTTAAAALPARCATTVAVLTVIAASVLTAWPLGPVPGLEDTRAPLELVGHWTAMVVAVVFIGLYVGRVAMEIRHYRSAVALAEEALARERRLSALGGMAAAAAHELGTPLATIQTTARELERQLDGEQKEDAGVIVDQARRCRKILGRLSDRGDAGDVVHDQMPLSSVLEEASEPFLGAADVRIELHGAGELAGPPPDLKRTPEILYALKNLVENACGFAESTVVVEAVWDGERVEIRIMDDGPGYPPEVLARLGEPYVGGWMRRDTNGRDHQGGLGLGLFIAKTMVERTGGTISFGRAPREKGLTGAMASVTWPRSTVEARGLRGRQPTKTGFPDDRDASNDTTPAYTG